MKLKYKLNLQLFAGEEPGVEVEEAADLPNEPEEPNDIEWESFDSDKPEISEEKPEVADPAQEQEEEKPTRDFEKDRAFADMRRRAEEAERRANTADEWVKQNYGDKGINNWSEYQQALADQRKREEYEEKGIDYDEVRKIAKEEAEQHPDVIKAKEIERKYAINSDIRELKTAFPDVQISEIEDLKDVEEAFSKLPNWEKIKERILKNYSLKDAYELANYDEIVSKRVAAAAQAERSKIKSKDHLKPSGSGSADESIAIPDDTMIYYEKMFAKQLKSGKMKREDFAKHYKRSIKGG